MRARRLTALILALILLSGCGWLDGSYVSVTPHQEQAGSEASEVVSASNYSELITVLESFVATGREKGVINVVNYELAPVETQMVAAKRHIREIYPIGAYAVEDIRYELGTNTGKPALAVEIQYRSLPCRSAIIKRRTWSRLSRITPGSIPRRLWKCLRWLLPITEADIREWWR